jgi:hypothetical protein
VTIAIVLSVFKDIGGIVGRVVCEELWDNGA